MEEMDPCSSIFDNITSIIAAKPLCLDSEIF